MTERQASRMKEIQFSGIREVFDQVNELERDGEDIVHMEIGRPDFDTPKRIKRAAGKALEEGKVHYTNSAGILELRQALSEKFRQENDLDYSSDEIVVTAGASEAIFSSFLAFLNQGNEVLIPEPMYVYYADWPQFAGAKTVPVPLSSDEGFQPVPELIEQQINPETAMLVINTPQNPTGAVFEKSKLREVAEIAKANDLLVLADEIYEYMTFGKTQHTSIASLPGMRSRTITINGFSKAYSMTGWRLGYLAAPRELIPPILKTRQHTSNCPCSFAQWGALEGVKNCSKQVEHMVKEFGRRNQLVCERLEESPYFDLGNPTGAFYAFPSIRNTQMDDQELADFLLEKAGVAVVPGSCFGQAGQGHVRIAYSTSQERLQHGFDRIEKALHDH